jgi:hypothetical protein
MSRDEFTLETARRAADDDRLADWVMSFLASPGSDTAELGEMLDERLGWWVGPVRLPIERLHRLAGPPGDPVLCPVDDDYWRDDVDELGDKIEDGLEPAPVIVAYRESRFELEDGNHRVEALRRAGEDHSWAVVGFESAEDRERFLHEHAA